MKTTLTITFFFLAIFSMAQGNMSRADQDDFADADFYFYQERFSEAHEILVDLHTRYPKNCEVSFRLGVCELKVFKNKTKAHQLLKQSNLCGIQESKFYLAQIHHLNHEFDSAISLLKDCENILKDKKEDVTHLINNCKMAQELISNPTDVLVFNLGENINSEFAEYIPLINEEENEIYFTSRRPNSTGGKTDPNKDFFEDIYHAKREGGEWGTASNEIENINTNSHDATVAISSNGKSMLLYRTNKKLTGGDLYITSLLGDQWTEPKLLDKKVNSEFQEASACFGSDGKILIFSSTRPEGFGGKDLYRVIKLPNGEWSLPKNLGPDINTEFDEDAPFLDVDNRTLYFASQGHKSMGGYDVFTSRKQGRDRWSNPKNLGYPANSVEDDIYLSLTPGGRKGYYSSEKADGFGDQDLYEINFIYRQQTNLILKGELKDEEGNPIQGEISIIEDGSSDLIGLYNSNENTGKFILILNPMVKYKMIIEAEGKESQMDELYFEFPDKNNTELTLEPYILN